MSFTKKSFLVFSLALLLVAPTLAVTAQNNEGSDQKKQQKTVLAKVNGAEITQQELSKSAQVYQIVMTLSRQYRTFGQFLMSSKAGQKFLTEYRKHVLDQMIGKELQKQKIKELGITVSDKEVQKEIDKIIENNKQFKDEKALEDYLKKNQNMSLADLKSRMKESLKSQKLRDEVTGDITVSEKEINSYYEKNKKSFTDDKGNVKPLKDVKSQIKSTLKDQRKSQAFSKWLKKAREEANIEKYPEKL